MDIWADGQYGLVFEFALQHLTGEAVMDRYQPDWRERYDTDSSCSGVAMASFQFGCVIGDLWPTASRRQGLTKRRSGRVLSRPG